jgi:hypothetical protein
MQTAATFFITTARSGTQWLSETLKTIYPDLLVVEHEPIGHAYSSKMYLRNPAALTDLRAKPVVREHLDRIHGVLRQKSYVEVGCPAFAAAPLLTSEFGKRFRLVQLVRHPVRVAISITAQQWFDPGRRNALQGDTAPAPTDPGAYLRHYRARWATMTPFERSLFYWAEVHLYGLEVRKQLPDVPFLQLTLEDLLAGTPAQTRLAAFLDVPYRPAWREASAIRIDALPKHVNTIDRSPLQDHPEIASLARHFGYDIGDADIGYTDIRHIDIGDSDIGDPRFNQIADIGLSPRQRVLWRRFRKVGATLIRMLDAMYLGGIVRGAKRIAKTRLS